MGAIRGQSNLKGLPGYSFAQHELPERMRKTGSVKGKKAVMVDERTTVYVDRKATKAEREAIRGKVFEAHGGV